MFPVNNSSMSPRLIPNQERCARLRTKAVPGWRWGSELRPGTSLRVPMGANWCHDAALGALLSSNPFPFLPASTGVWRYVAMATEKFPLETSSPEQVMPALSDTYFPPPLFFLLLIFTEVLISFAASHHPAVDCHGRVPGLSSHLVLHSVSTACVWGMFQRCDSCCAGHPSRMGTPLAGSVQGTMSVGTWPF